jgi:hypothetical protein
VPTITLKNVPKSLHARLARRARIHKRSLNQEAIACLEERLQETKPVLADVWEQRFQKIRETIQIAPLDDDFLEGAVARGRPGIGLRDSSQP